MPEVGLFVPTSAPDARPDTVLAFGQRAEAAGVHSLWVPDRPVFDGAEPLLALTALAATTTRARLGTCVLLGTLRPDLLKAYRNRVEHAVKVLPAQGFAYIQLHYETVRGWEPGIREWVSICRGLGMTRPQVGSAIVFAMMYGGVSVMSVVERAAGDILGNW